MKVHPCVIALLLGSTIAIVHATLGGQYGINVHFVPPLVSAPCALGQFWLPPNMTCAMCFCLTGSISRCVPQPGCNPANSTTTAPPPGSAASSVPSTPTQAPQQGSNQNPTSQISVVTGDSVSSSAEPTSPASAAVPTEASSAASASVDPSSPAAASSDVPTTVPTVPTAATESAATMSNILRRRRRFVETKF